jgi:hypothetical protein
MPSLRGSALFGILYYRPGRPGQDFQFNPDQNRAAARVNGGGGISPVEAMKICKNRVAERLPGVALAYINTARGSDEGDGSYMINFNARPPPSGRKSDGFCVVTRSGESKGFDSTDLTCPKAAWVRSVASYAQAKSKR